MGVKKNKTPLEYPDSIKMWKVGYPKFGLSDFYHSQVVFNSEFFDISIYMSRRQLFPLFTYSNARLPEELTDALLTC